MSDHKLNGPVIYQKLKKIVSIWKNLPADQSPDALVVVMGKRRDEPIRVSTVDFFLWLLNYEFPDTVLVISKKSAIFATSQKKKTLLEEMKQPDNYDGPDLKVVVKDNNLEGEALSTFVRDFMK